jgi:two-component system, OmpR family, sensor histidine kinase BaeS
MAWDINLSARRMLKSLWVKFLLLLFSVSIISLSAALFLREMIISDFEEYLEGKAEDQIYRLLAAIEGSYEKNAGWNEDALKEKAVWALLFGYRIKITDVRDNELINTKKAVESLPPLMKKRIIAVSGFSPEEKPSVRQAYTTYPLFLAGKDIGFLQIRPMIFEEGQEKEAVFMMRSNRFLIISLFFLGGLSVLLSLVFSRRLTEPIKKLTMAAEQISRGNIKSRVAVSGNSEISTLSKTFNTMADNLEIQESLRRKMTSNVAHELRTPLSAMQGEIEGMLDGLMKVDRERLLSLHEETGRLRHIIEGMEELSRAEASVLEMRKQSINLKPFLTNIKGRFEKLFFDKDVRLELECDETMKLYADPDKLSQIVINLLSNALRVTDRGGRVWIKTGTKGQEGYISVSDTGCGIKKENLPFIFERFYKSSEGGLGIGLTIAKELTEAHGGRIEVQTEYGKGSTFTLYI